MQCCQMCVRNCTCTHHSSYICIMPHYHRNTPYTHQNIQHKRLSVVTFMTVPSPLPCLFLPLISLLSSFLSLLSSIPSLSSLSSSPSPFVCFSPLIWLILVKLLNRGGRCQTDEVVCSQEFILTGAHGCTYGGIVSSFVDLFVGGSPCTLTIEELPLCTVFTLHGIYFHSV